MPSNNKFSVWISFKKGIRAVLEVLSATFIATLPQMIDNLLGLVDEAREVEAVGLPAEWTVFWLIGVRMFTNWWKNRNLA